IMAMTSRTSISVTPLRRCRCVMVKLLGHKGAALSRAGSRGQPLSPQSSEFTPAPNGLQALLPYAIVQIHDWSWRCAFCLGPLSESRPGSAHAPAPGCQQAKPKRKAQHNVEKLVAVYGGCAVLEGLTDSVGPSVW